MYKKVFFLYIAILLLSSRSVSAEKIQYTSFFPNPLGEVKALKIIPLQENIFYTPPPADILGTSCSFPGRIFYSDDLDMLLSCNKSWLSSDTHTYNWGYLPGVWRYEDFNLYLSDTVYPNATFLGIGVNESETSHKLTLGYDGSIIAAGTYNASHPTGSFNLLTTGHSDATETGTRFIWYPEKAAFRAGGIKNDAIIATPAPSYDPTADTTLGWKDANIGDFSVAFGVNNEALGKGSAILGGEYGKIDPDTLHSVILNGPLRAVIHGFCHYSVSIGGSIDSSQNAFTGGFWDKANDRYTGIIHASTLATVFNSGYIETSTNSFIGSGLPNPDVSANPYNPAADLTGWINILADDFGATIHSSPSSTIMSAYAIIFSSSYAFIGSGSQHLLNDSDYAVILGGKRATIQGGDYSVILGGENNTSGEAIVLLADGDSVIDTIGGTHQLVGSGKNNRTFTSYSIVMGGENNAAGSLNKFLYATHAVVAGGANNKAFGLFSYIGGGSQNRIGSACFDADQDAVCDGTGPPYTGPDVIGDPDYADGKFSVILGGQDNTITGNYGFIGAGKNNTISGDYSVIEGGENNTITSDHSWGFGKNLTINAANTWVWNYTHSSASVISNPNNFIVFNDTAGTGADPVRVGIQTLDPQATLDVVGNVKANTMILTASVSLTGTPLNVAADGQIGRDLAEVFPASEAVSPGDLVVLDKTSEKILLTKSRAPYDTTIIGVVSSAPAMIFKEDQIISDFSVTPETTQKPPVALSGQVPCKVSLENGPITYGDLLTTSSTPGHAMKATEREKSFGTIVGKALEPFNGNPSTGEPTGTINIYVSLQ